MSTGAERAEPHAGWVETETRAEDWLGAAAEPEAFDPPAPERASRRVRAFGAILLVLAAAWIGAALWQAWQAGIPATASRLVPFLATLSAPLALLGLLWLLFGRSGRRETERFTAAVQAMR